ncbi:protein phosphatase regulator [Kalmusia sp. IMI 367209]|nr:protein phosphatase regulator [Kalmusia sp. IMI 367209]
MTDVMAPPGEMLSQHAPLRPSASQASFFDSDQAPFAVRRNSYSFSDLRSSLNSSRSSSIRSTPASSLSLDTKSEDELSSSDDEGLAFPAYRAAEKPKDADSDAAPSSPLLATDMPSPIHPPASTPDHVPVSEDDTNLRPEPSQHVDYLSHDWKEEDIWSSWRHIVEHRSVYGERSRLENASWRQWAKAQFGLRTVTPESLNWLKESDVTWLYGPLQPSANRTANQNASEPTSRLSKSNSFLNKKPILKKRSMSEVMLQRSISASSLVSQAAAAVQAQQATSVSFEGRRRRPLVGRATASDFTLIPTRTISRDTTDYFSSQSTSGLITPDHGERKHIRFDEKVEQCIAVECKGVDEDDEEDFNHNPWAKYRDDDSSSDEGVVMMKRSRRKRPLSRTNSKTSISGENKTIAKLPSTTLKYRTDSPDVTEQQPTHSLGFFRSSRLSPSPSQETLRPSHPSSNFLLPEDDDEDEVAFNPAGAYEVKRASTPTPSDPYSIHPDEPPVEVSDSIGLRRTPSGMFMPFEDEDEDPQQPGIIGRVVDTVNTARDIAHVIWNVGWRSGN